MGNALKLSLCCSKNFADKEGHKDKHRVEFSCTGKQHVFLELIEKTSENISSNERDIDLGSTRGPPTNISVLDNSVTGVTAMDIDELTNTFSVFGGSQTALSCAQRSMANKSSRQSVPAYLNQRAPSPSQASQWTFETVSDTQFQQFQEWQRMQRMQQQHTASNRCYQPRVTTVNEHEPMPPPAPRTSTTNQNVVASNTMKSPPLNPIQQNVNNAPTNAPVPQATFAAQVAAIAAARNRRGKVRTRENDTDDDSNCSRKRFRSGGDAAAAAGSILAQAAEGDDADAITLADSEL